MENIEIVLNNIISNIQQQSVCELTICFYFN